MSYNVRFAETLYKQVEFRRDGENESTLLEINEIARKEFPEDDPKNLILEAGEDQDGFPVILSRANKHRVR